MTTSEVSPGTIFPADLLDQSVEQLLARLAIAEAGRAAAEASSAAAEAGSAAAEAETEAILTLRVNPATHPMHAPSAAAEN
jgi:hypothetical protein